MFFFGSGDTPMSHMQWYLVCLGFPAVPTVPAGEKDPYDSLSGFTLFILKGVGGVLVVNGVKPDSW